METFLVLVSTLAFLYSSVVPICGHVLEEPTESHETQRFLSWCQERVFVSGAIVGRMLEQVAKNTIFLGVQWLQIPLYFTESFSSRSSRSAKGRDMDNRYVYRAK